MSNLDHLVVGVDGSDGSQRALRWAAAQTPERLTVVHGFSPGLELLAAAAQINLDPARAEHERLLRTTWSEAGRAEATELETVLVDDNPAKSLAHVALTRKADAIVLGHHGLNPWSAHHVGDIAGRLLHHCPVPLILTSATTEAEPLSGPLVVGLSHPADIDNPEVIWALETAGTAHLPVHLVSFVAPLPFIDSDFSFDMTRIHEEMRSQMAAFVENLDLQNRSITVSSEIRDSIPLQGLVEIADETHASMVVVGSHHPGPIGGFIAGSVARMLPPLLECPMAAISHP